MQAPPGYKYKHGKLVPKKNNGKSSSSSSSSSDKKEKHTPAPYVPPPAPAPHPRGKYCCGHCDKVGCIILGSCCGFWWLIILIGIIAAALSDPTTCRVDEFGVLKDANCECPLDDLGNLKDENCIGIRPEVAFEVPTVEEPEEPEEPEWPNPTPLTCDDPLCTKGINEAFNRKGASQCSSNCECGGKRNCSIFGWCTFGPGPCDI